MKLASKILQLHEDKKDIRVSGEDDAISVVKGASISTNSKNWKVAQKDGKFYISKDGKIYTEVDKDNPAINEGQHYNTRMRQVESNKGSRHIRMAMKELYKRTENMLDTGHPSPNPRDNKDKKNLEESKVLMEQCMHRLKEVKETKKRRKK